jgi:diacylglycerol O-acyltransferase / wax synthase
VAARRRLSTQDQFWLEMDRPNNLMVVDAVMWTAQPLDWDRLRDVMDERVTGRYPVFRSLAVHEPDGSWWWEESPDYDLDNHVQMVKLDDPSDPRSLQQLVADNRTRMLDRSKPLWEAMWVEEYLEGSAVVLRSHHAIADGVRMVELAMTMFEAGPDGGSVLSPGITHHAAKAAKVAGDSAGRPSAGRTRSLPGVGQLATDARRSAGAVLARVPGAAREAARLARASVVNPVGAGHGFITETAHAANDALHSVQERMQAVLPGGGVINVIASAPSDLDVARKLVLGTRNDPTIWTGHPTTDKGVAWADPIPLADVRAIAKANGATINDVLVSCLAGSLERYLRLHGEHCASTTFMVPVNLKPLNDSLPDELGNAFALIYLELPTSQPDPMKVLDVVKRRTVRMKHGHEPAVTFKIQEEIAGLGHTMYVASIDYFANRATGVLTNVPGPQMPVYLAGSRVEGIVGWAPMSGNQSMSLTIYSYAGKVIVGIAADTTLVPGYEQIVDGFAAVFDALKAETTL